ncbi:MAG: hypothetical protein IPL87_01420 [Candidatus Moraniibacteriota bacterium]|nr:MAG: hypothetical protein IPL87_01420 [Candidatus Moranbacteria bacterium]
MLLKLPPKRAVDQATFLDKDGARLVIKGGKRGDDLKVAIELAMLKILHQLSLCDPVLTENRLLKPVATAIVPARTKPFNAAAFYQTGTGLYVYKKFVDHLYVNDRRTTVGLAPERPYVALCLKERDCDKAIRANLPETHLSTLEDIAGLIEAQSGGKSGLLFNDGFVNIFYVEGRNGEVFAVCVFWDSEDDCRWFVSSRVLGEDGDWGDACQVLCPGTAVL